jgi:transcriptional regulator with XRE-family HTH domain
MPKPDPVGKLYPCDAQLRLAYFAFGLFAKCNEKCEYDQIQSSFGLNRTLSLSNCATPLVEPHSRIGTEFSVSGSGGAAVLWGETFVLVKKSVPFSWHARTSEMGKIMSHPVDIHVGQRIRQRRWAIGMTQQQLAEAVGIKFQQIQKYETGMNRVSASRLWDIAQALRVSINFFFEDVNAASQPEGEEMMSNKETLDLLRTYYTIPETQRKRLFDLARALGDAA